MKYSDSDQFDRDVQAMRAAYLKTHRADMAIDALAAAVSRRTPRKRASSRDFLAESLASRDAYLRKAEARRADLERRNGAKARAAFDHYERTRAQFGAEREFEPELSPLVAATMHISPPPFRVY